MQNINKHSKLFFVICLIIIGMFYLYPQINYQPQLAQGDHGRDLYSAFATSLGDTPYQDYWWVYGPLMPYFYGFFQSVFGMTVGSILLGKTLLVLASSILIYLILTTIISPALSVIGGLWFLVFKPDFFFTYNHAGGITLTLAVLYCSLLYINNQKNMFLLWGLLSAVLLCFIKINFGLTAFVVLAFSTFLGITLAPFL